MGVAFKAQRGADRTVLIICDVKGGMSPGKSVTAGKSGNSKNRRGKKHGGKKTGTSEAGSYESRLV